MCVLACILFVVLDYLCCSVKGRLAQLLMRSKHTVFAMELVHPLTRAVRQDRNLFAKIWRIAYTRASVCLHAY